MDTKKLIRIRNRVELIYRLKFRAAINAQVEPVISKLKDLPAEAVLADIYIDPEPIRKSMTDLYADIGLPFSWSYRRALFAEKSLIEEWERFFNTFILPAIIDKTAQRITRITTTTASLVRDAIQRGIEHGLGIDKIADFVREEMQNITDYRARMIAQTETISASNRAAFEGANSAGIKYRKFWSNSGLEGVRESHIFAQEWSYGRDGVEPSEPFDMGNGTFMMHPGDPDGPPEEVINCRCTLIVEPV